MSERRKIQNLRSDKLVQGQPKLPLPSDIDYGEIAINYAKGNETFAIKNDNDEIVSFSLKSVNPINNIIINDVNATITDRTASVVIKGQDINIGDVYEKTVYQEPFNTIVEEIDGHVKANDTLNVSSKKIEKTISALNDESLDNEKVVAAAINKMIQSVGLENPENKIKYVPNKNTYYINTSTSINDATIILDKELKKVSDNVDEIKNTIITDELVLSNALTAITDAVGVTDINDEIKYINENDCHYIKDATSVHHATVILDSSIKKVSDDAKSNNEELKEKVINNELVTANSIFALAEATGVTDVDDTIKFVKKDNPFCIGNAQNLTEAVNILDERLRLITNLIDSKFKQLIAANPNLNKI